MRIYGLIVYVILLMMKSCQKKYEYQIKAFMEYSATKIDFLIVIVLKMKKSRDAQRFQ